MATQDLSRWATDPAKHYSGVQMQQGRVLEDDDWNEDERIAAEQRRLDRLQVIGPVGTSDGGFRISNPTVSGSEMDFTIGSGSYFVSGLRADLESDERFSAQDDWLDQTQPERTAPTTSRNDLVYLEAWEQPVSAVEDNELFEVALGGPDTTTRTRVMQRVKVATDVGTGDCAAAWAAVRDRWATGHVGTVDGHSELVTNAALTVGFEGGGDPADLCSPAVAKGYLGAENQAIRVELIDSTRFTWGFDNASPLYRVHVAADGKTVTMLTEPKDHAHWPLTGQIVELLSWSAVLPNREKLAATQGHLSRVDGSYDPDLQQFSLASTSTLPPNFGTEWQARLDAASLGPAFFYLRVWDRGSDLTSDPAIAFTPGTPVPLGHTGLTVTLVGPNLNGGDHWVVAARPETPSRVVPWNFESPAGRPPHGVRRFVAPLAILEWTASGSTVSGQVVSDCRETFRPLTRLGGCCTYTVGDGEESHGDFASIQAAIDNLPLAGGQVCVLPGKHTGHVHVKHRANVTISGCGRRSRLVTFKGDVEQGAIRITDSSGVVVRGLAIEAKVATAVRVRASDDVTIEDLHILVRDRAGIYGDGASQLEVLRNEIEVEALESDVSVDSDTGLWPAIFLSGDEILVERNTIRVGSPGGLVRAALGGIQIGGGSDDVEIRRNRILGGLGNGITLGSIRYVDKNSFQRLITNYRVVYDGATTLWPGWGYHIEANGCLSSPTGQTPTGNDGQPLIPLSEDTVTGVRIIDNLIASMGANGIGVARFFAPDERGSINVDRLTIDQNTIRSCVRLSTPPMPAALRDLYGFGGVALAHCQDLVIRDNLIEDNGTSHIDPICGVFVLYVGGVFLSGNRILDNGPVTSIDHSPQPGRRGGIVIGNAFPQTHPIQEPVSSTQVAQTDEVAIAEPAKDSASQKEVRRMQAASSGKGLPSGNMQAHALPGEALDQSGAFAAWVHGNVVVAAAGPALAIRAIGSVVVEDNRLVTRAAVIPDPPPTSAITFVFNGAAVSIIDLGVSAEYAAQATSFSALAGTSFIEPAGTATSDRVLAGGDVLFNDNQVRLDSIAAGNAVSSVLIGSRDDVSMHGNQSECGPRVRAITTNTMVGGWSVRMADNRFAEAMTATDRSAMTLALMNSTVENQSTHCLWVAGQPALTLNERNIALAVLADAKHCQELKHDGLALGSGLFAFQTTSAGGTVA
jgi:hypothetical protein